MLVTTAEVSFRMDGTEMRLSQLKCLSYPFTAMLVLKFDLSPRKKDEKDREKFVHSGKSAFSQIN